VAAGLCVLVAPVIGYLVAQSAVVAGGLVVAVVAGALLVGRPWWLVPPLLVGAWFNMATVTSPLGLLSLADIASAAMIPLWVLHRLSSSERPRVVPEVWALAAFVVVSYASMVNGVNPSSAYNAFARFIHATLTCVAVIDLCNTPRRLHLSLAVIAACGVAHSVVALATYPGSGRLGGLFEQPNALGHMVSIAFLAGLSVLTQARSRNARLALFAGLGVMAIAIVLTISRGTYLAVGLALAWWLRKHRQAIVVLVLAGGLAATVVPRFLSNAETQIAGRLEMDDDSVEHRWATVLNGLNALEAHPFMGVGFGQFRELNRAVEVTRQAGRSAHNFYLSVAVSSGLPALALFIAFVFPMVRRLWRWQRASELAQDPTSRDVALLVAGVQAISIYLALAFLTKGGDRMTVWCLLGLIGATSLLPSRRST